MKMQIDLNQLSKYRTPLMGLAALMIIICHAPQYGVTMPITISSLLQRGGLGVDIFLFLSGLGCYYSLSKGVALRQWYYKRFIRIFVPYLFIQIPFWIWKLCNGVFSFSKELMVFSTIDFWLNHTGAWYIALLIPLYSLTPLIYMCLQLGNRIFLAGLMVVVLIIVCMLNIDTFNGAPYAICNNLQWAFGRVPSFIIGMAAAPLIKRGMKIHVGVLIILPLIFYVAIHEFINKNTPTQWCLVLPVLTVLILSIEYIRNKKFVYHFISWMGIVSLESYLANIYLCNMLKEIFSPLRANYPLLTNGYLEYSLVILLGILLSLLINKMSMPIVAKLDTLIKI